MYCAKSINTELPLLPNTMNAMQGYIFLQRYLSNTDDRMDRVRCCMTSVLMYLP